MEKEQKSMLIKNAKICNEDELKDILIIESKFKKIEHHIDFKADEIVDIDGFIVTPTFIDPHLHIDKAFTFNEVIREEDTLEESIKLMHGIKKNYTVDDVKSRALKAIKESIKYGVTKIRAHIDIDNICGLVALEGCLLAKEEVKDIVDIQIVAFPQEGIFCNKGTDELMIKAIEMGANVVGGMPAAEWIDEDSKKHVDFVFELAKKYNLDIDMHVDQTKDFFSRSLEYIAYKTIKENYEGRVTAAHCTSLAYQNDSHAKKVMELIKIADINICVNPSVLLIMGVDPEPRTRGLTRARELIEKGINVAIAQDTISDGFHLFGTGDPLDYGLLFAYAAQFNSTDKISKIFDMITYNGAKIMKIENYGIKENNPADFNIIFCKKESECLRLRPGRMVFKNGKLISKIEKNEEIYF
ncbi:MAG: amidohydrolase family protein [Caldisericia bacterium]|nr:amidohydrolase family protein [Caldisericia bacterium]